MSIIREYDKLPIEAVKKVGPSVVSIVISKHLSKMKKNFLIPFMGGEAMGFGDGSHDGLVKVGGGSGFIVHEDGLVLTNKHVVFDKEAEYTVITSDGTQYKAKVLSRDPVNDIAVLKIDASGLEPLSMGDSSKIELGQTVLAVGNALGMFSNSVSKGIISGLSRSISASLGGEEHTEELRGVIQTDVAINQGNSGGPLVNLDGHAVGINTAVIFGAQNIGFSIPINWAKEDLKDIIEHGRIIKPYLGLQFIMLDKNISKKYELPVEHGAVVMRDHRPDSQAVIPKSPAARAGIKENDIILSVDNDELKGGTDLRDILQKCHAGQEIVLSLMRGSKTIKVKVKLSERV